MALLRKLLTEDNIAAGDFHGHTFCTWDQSVDQILQKIETDWQQLGRDPTIGEVAWFTCREGL